MKTPMNKKETIVIVITERLVNPLREDSMVRHIYEELKDEFTA